jgi:arabinofuranan 3-O-arabinosyltransferase
VKIHSDRAADQQLVERATAMPVEATWRRSERARRAAAAATVACWIAAVASWVPLYIRTLGDKGLAWDLLTTWRAERVFAHGGAPYAVKAFLYPPSSLLLFRPLAALSSHELKVVGLAATVVVAWAAVMLSAEAIGLRWWGITSAVTILLLSFTQAMTGELGLENVTVLCFLALAAFFFLSIRDHWVLGGVAIGLSLAIKPLLLPVLLVFLLARQWRGFAAAAGVPVALNLLALAFVANPSQVFSKLPSLLDRTGTGVALNSAWVDVSRTLALPVGVSVTLRVVTVAVVLVGTWWAWHVLDDRVFRIVTSSSLLLIGAYLAGTLSEYHFMLTLVPLAMTAVLPRSPIRTIGGALGMVWLMGHLTLPRSVLGVGTAAANNSAFRAFGMSLVLVSIVVVLGRRRQRQPKELWSA